MELIIIGRFHAREGQEAAVGCGDARGIHSDA